MYEKITDEEYLKKNKLHQENYDKLPDTYKKHFVVPTLEHLSYIAEHISAEHEMEIGLIFDEKYTKEQIVNRAFLLSSVCVVLVDEDKIMGIGGIGESNDIWLLLCEEATQNKAMHKLLTDEAKPLIDFLLDNFSQSGFLENVIPIEATTQRKWLEWLGAMTTPLKVNGSELLAFTFMKKE